MAGQRRFEEAYVDGKVHAVKPLRLLAVATNPWNPSGPDADAAEFRAAVATALPDVSVHDVVLEGEGGERKSAWKFWE